MYEKLLRTAREMNMTVLSKLLEAHRQPQVAKQPQPILLNKNAPVNRATQIIRKTAPPKPVSAGNPVVFKHHQTTIKPVQRNIPESIQIVTKYNQDTAKSRPSRFNVPDEIVPDSENSFDKISYESKPILTASQIKKEEENSPFESLRKGYTNKRVAVGAAGPPTKKLNLDDVKEMSEAQRQRSQLTDDDDDDPDYDGDTNFNEDDFEEDGTTSETQKGKYTALTKQITVKDDGGNVNHAKIISEVLKKYPHLVKNHKNIKLKIMQRPSQSNSKQTTAIVQAIKQEKPGTSSKIVTSTPQATSRPTGTTITTTAQPKRIDAKTMHALIAKGAENMTGPWLCLKCGVNGRPISIPSYKSFRKHLITIHNEKIDPRICEHCGFKVQTGSQMFSHLQQEHQIKPPADVKLTTVPAKKAEQQCIYCDATFTKEFLLFAHMRSQHRHKAKSDGVIDFGEEEYVPNMDSTTESSSSSKIKIISDVSIAPFELDGNALIAATSQPSSEAEALSNVATGIATSLGLVADSGTTYDDNFIENQLAHVHGEFVKKEDISGGADVITKLITEDGTELALTQSQKEEILAQLQNQGANLSENVVMVLDQGQFGDSTADTNNMVVMYAQPGDEYLQTTEASDSQTVQQLTSEELENAEIVFQTNDSGNLEAAEIKEESIDGQSINEVKKNLVSELEGDWSMENEEASEKSDKKEETKDDADKKLENLLADWNDDDESAGNNNNDAKEESSEKKDQESESQEENQTKEDKIEATRTVEEEMQFVFGETGDDVALEQPVTEEKDVLSVIDELKSEETPTQEADSNGEGKDQNEETKPDENSDTKVEDAEKGAIDTEETSKDGKPSEIGNLLNEWTDDL
jgi:hypothetical protein